MSESVEAIIDAIEGETARLEIEGRAVEVARGVLPAAAQEGDVVEIRLRPDLKAARLADMPQLHTDDDGQDLDV